MKRNYTSSKEDYKDSSSSDEDVENISLMVKKFGNFLKRSKDRKFSKPLKKFEKFKKDHCA